MCHRSHETIAYWANLVGTVVAVASLVLSLVALSIAKSSLSSAKQVAEQEQRDWKQRKWFDLYFQASEFYDHLDRFKNQFEHMAVANAEDAKAWNDVMFQARRVHSMALVFPKNPAIDKLFAVTAVFENRQEAFSRERLEAVLDAVEGLRQMALVHASVLG